MNIRDKNKARQLYYFKNGTNIDYSIDEDGHTFVSAEAGYVGKRYNEGQSIHFRAKLNAYRPEIRAIHFDVVNFVKGNRDIDLFSECYVSKILIKEKGSDTIQTITMDNDRTFEDVINEYRKKYNWKKI